ncbi:hypothetical protein [Palleronia marisminoris]|nr:hypothetical protein [Palleronia marisminoris]
MTRLRGWLYRGVIRHWMNERVEAIRSGRLVPSAAATAHDHEETRHAA